MRGISKARVVAVAVVMLVAGAAATTWAAIPDTDGTISGCYAKSGGKLRVVKAGKACRSRERAIAWSRTGPAGVAGAPGSRGPAGPKGAQGPKGVAGGPGLLYTAEGFDSLAGGVSRTLGELDLPAGRYLVIGTGQAFDDEAVAGIVSCFLVTDADFFGAVSQTVPSQQWATITAQRPVELATAQKVRVDCIDEADTNGVTMSLTLSAIPVASIVKQSD